MRDVSRRYRTWAFESAALDLALRQAGRSLADQLGRELRPLTYVVSMRLGAFDSDEPETSEKMLRVLERYPGTRFKLDPTNTWSDALIEELAASGAVDSLDLKGQYKGTPVDVETDPELYAQADRGLPRRLARGPRPKRRDAPDARAGARPRHLGRPDPLRRRRARARVGAAHGQHQAVARRARCSSSAAPTTSAPSAASAPTAAARPSWASGRDHIQYLAALFHPDTPNDVAPRGFNMPQLPDGMPASPIEIEPAATGFRFA